MKSEHVVGDLYFAQTFNKVGNKSTLIVAQSTHNDKAIYSLLLLSLFILLVCGRYQKSTHLNSVKHRVRGQN